MSRDKLVAIARQLERLSRAWPAHTPKDHQIERPGLMLDLLEDSLIIGEWSVVEVTQAQKQVLYRLMLADDMRMPRADLLRALYGDSLTPSSNRLKALTQALNEKLAPVVLSDGRAWAIRTTRGGGETIALVLEEAV